jgi:hypothetical protein
MISKAIVGAMAIHEACFKKMDLEAIRAYFKGLI